MSLFENQTFRKKLSYAKINEQDKKVTFNISINTNHNMDHDVLKSVENTIISMLINNYENIDEVKRKEEKEKEEIKLKHKQELERIKNEKLQLMRQREIEKNNLILEKQRLAHARKCDKLQNKNNKTTKSSYKARTNRLTGF